MWLWKHTPPNCKIVKCAKMQKQVFERWRNFHLFHLHSPKITFYCQVLSEHCFALGMMVAPDIKGITLTREFLFIKETIVSFIIFFASSFLIHFLSFFLFLSLSFLFPSIISLCFLFWRNVNHLVIFMICVCCCPYVNHHGCPK